MNLRKEYMSRKELILTEWREDAFEYGQFIAPRRARMGRTSPGIFALYERIYEVQCIKCPCVPYSSAVQPSFTATNKCKRRNKFRLL